jgi:anti-sigma factor RsiW
MRKLSCAQARKIVACSRREDWPEQLRPALRVHLQACARCRRELAAHELLRQAIGAQPRVPLRADFLPRLMERLAEQRAGATARSAAPAKLLVVGRWRPLLAAVSVLILLLGATLAWYQATSGHKDTGAGMLEVGPSSETVFLQELVWHHESLVATTPESDAGVVSLCSGF